MFDQRWSRGIHRQEHVRRAYGMNINHEEFLEVLSDIKKAPEMYNVDEADQDRLMALNFGLKDEVISH